MLMKNVVPLRVQPVQAAEFPIDVEVAKIGCSRHAARELEATEAQIDDRRSKGYRMHPPAGICFRSRYLLTSEPQVEVQGAQTSGEVEFVAVRHGGEIFVTVGSDHNDRSIEDMSTEMLGKVYDSAKLKQLAPAALGSEAWLYEDVRDHWDDLILRSSITCSGERVPYQEFTLLDLLDLTYYLDRCPWLEEEGAVLFGGSSAVLPSVPESVYKGQAKMEDVYFPPDFHCEIFDLVLDRVLTHSYEILALEEPGSFGL